ncbi:MAG: hypothetical protein N3G20_10550 [Verrucomicrobiae bacterium]|nr:hypothetical protein [Verrucomicrobiae bacterium]
MSTNIVMPIINLTEEQKAKVRAWLEQGLKLSEIQSRLDTEFGVRATYMDVKRLVSDLQVLPKDPEVPVQVAKKTAQPESDKGANKETRKTEKALGRVTIKTDDFPRPGAIVSGSVTFSDGKTAAWYIDEYGRIGVAPSEPGYRPTESDMREFQVVLEQELARQGF